MTIMNMLMYIFFKEKTTGIIGGVSVNTLKNLLFAMPPIAEQERIVAEIEKFEPLIAEYDKLEQQATKLDGEIYDKLKKSILQCPNERCQANGNPRTKAHIASHPVWSGELLTQKWSLSLHVAVSC